MADPIQTAVITTAGLGTRFLPVTRAVQKMLLPVIDRPLIHYAAAEVAAAGIDRAVLVTGPADEAVVGYFSPNPVVERVLAERGNDEELQRQRALTEMLQIEHVVQEEPLGFGHAVLMARDVVGDEPFALLLPDDLIWAERPAIRQLMDVRDAHGGSVLAAKRVPDEAIEALGIIAGNPVPESKDRVAGAPVDERVWRVTGLVEKPPLSEAPSNLAIIGRYVLSPAVFEHLAQGQRGAGGEIQLTDAISATLADEPVHACIFEGDHIDAGTPAGMLAASIYAARRDPAFHDRVQEILTRASQDG